jgi:hypothetical protein
MSKSRVAVAAIVAICNAGLPAIASAAERDLPRRVKAERYRPAELHCGCCGCLRVIYDYHRELRSTYGSHFDPRNYDQTEPHYYLGRVRAYPQYWTDRGGFEPHY